MDQEMEQEQEYNDEMTENINLLGKLVNDGATSEGMFEEDQFTESIQKNASGFGNSNVTENRQLSSPLLGQGKGGQEAGGTSSLFGGPGKGSRLKFGEGQQQAQKSPLFGGSSKEGFTFGQGKKANYQPASQSLKPMEGDFSLLEEQLKAQEEQRKLGNYNKLEVSLDNKKLVEGKVTDHFSLSFALDAFRIETYQYVQDLLLTGVEQVTDMFFLTLKVQRIGLPKLRTFSLTGSPFITDQGVQWLTKLSDIRISEISFSGCKNLTHKSLHAILTMDRTPTVVDMSLTAVCYLPLVLPSTTTLKLHGCPFISPPAAMLSSQKSLKDVLKGKALTDYENYKLLVLHDPSDIVKTGIFTQKNLDLSNPICVEQAWHPEPSDPHQYNVYECVTGQGCENWVLSNGCVIVLPFSKYDERTARKIAVQIMSVIGQYPENLFVLGGLSTVNENSLKSMLKRVNEVLTDFANLLFQSMSYKTSENEAVLKDHKFDDQIQTGLGHTLLGNLKSMLINKDLLSAVNLANDPKYSFLKSIPETFKKLFPWNTLSFFKETMKAFEAVMAKPRLITSLADVTKTCPPNLLKEFDSQSGCREISKVLEVLHDRGSCLYFPTIDKKPAFCDLPSLTSLISQLRGRSPQREHIPGVGMDIPCWRTDDFKILFSGKEGQVNLFLDVLTEQGLVFRFPCSLKDPKFTDTLVYVMSEDLPMDPDIPVDEVWPPDLPDGDLQKDIYFTFPSLPRWLLPCFLRKLQETSQIVLMWQSGLVLRQGPVIVLVELLTYVMNLDLPAIVISARVQNAAMSDALYVTFTNVNTILSGLLNSRSVFAMKTTGCDVCHPTKNRRLTVSQTNCTKKSGDRLKIKEESVVPDLKPYDLVPNHTNTKQVVTATNSENMDKSLRCHLCNNCGQNGMSCHGNLEPGITTKHCSCQHELSLCSYCGVCGHCTQVLAEAYAVVHPSFRLDHRDKNRCMGSIMAEPQFAPDHTYTFPDQLSLTYFSHLSMYMLTETCDFHINVYSPGMSVDYKTMMGTITINGQQKAQEVKCRQGDHVELKILRQMLEGTQKEVLEIRKNDVTLVSTRLMDRSARITCTHRPGSKMMVFTHKLMAMKNIQKTQKLHQKGQPVDKQENDDVLKCCGPFPTVIERKMSFAYKGFEIFLIEKLQKMFVGIAGVLLPKVMTVRNILYPSPEILRGLQMYHPVCTFNTSSVDYSAVDPCSFSLVHLVNGQGLPQPDSTTGLLQTLILGMHIILIHSQMDLPQYDHLFPELASAVPNRKCTDAQIRKGVQEILRIAAVSMVFSMFDSFSLNAFQKQDVFTTDKLAEEITSKLYIVVRQNLEKSGLEEVGYPDPDLYDSCFSQGLFCLGHSVCCQVGNKISEISPNWFGRYSKFITSFLLGDNQLTSLPPELFKEMPQLKVLDLRANYLEVLPDTLEFCKNLEELVLEGNNLFDLPSALDGCKELKKLDISFNRMEVLPPIVTKLHTLTHLHARGLLLTSLPDNFGNLSKLNVLNLNQNCLTKLPKSFSILQKLRELYLTGINWIHNKANNFLSKQNFDATTCTITRWLEGNADKFRDNDMFQYFDIDGSGTLDTQEIARANAILFDIFPRFGYKGKSSPDDKTSSGFPEEILALKNLTVLDLQYQGIVHVPKGIQNMESLTKLQLSSNPHLVSIAAEAGRCPLQHLNITDCPLLKTPPKEIRERGFATTYAYLKRLLTGSVDCKRTKLMLVGLGGAGKTSLVRALLTTLQQGESPLTGSGSVTDGIDICTWDVDYKGDTISYSVWDFAGQTVYYNTHQFFLSDRAVYLLLWNIRLGHEHAGLNFWLNSITVHAPKAPIFVVGTHTDQLTKVSLPMDEMRQNYHQIEGFHFVSSKDGNGIQDLREALFKATLQQEYMGEKIPQAWLQLESNIASKRVNQSVNVMDYKDIEAEALEVGIIDKIEVVQAIQFLHDLGMVQHFQREYLKDRVVINPQWIVDVMACVVSVKQTVVKDGRLMHADINQVWKEYPNMASWLLKLTEEFDLTYPLEGENCSIVPCLLPDKQPDFVWPEVKKTRKRKNKILETKLLYTFDYLPAGLFNRGQVRMYGISKDVVIWKRGTFLKKNGQQAFVQQIGDSELNVKVQGPRPDNLLFLIYEVFECLIKESFQGVTYECKIPCPDCVNQYTKFPHMFPASVIRRALEVKAPFLQCHKHFHSTPVLDLQGILAPDDNTDYDIHMSQDVFSLQQMQEAMTVDIFISYCVKDAPKNRSKVIHPADVCADLEQEGYTCFYPKDKQLHSREEMAKKLVHASVLMVFASNNYAVNDICCDMFKYAVNTMKKPTIVVAVGENFDWKQSTTLGVFMSDVVFVNMINSKKDVYKSKLAELLGTLQKNEQLSLSKPETSNTCFISYSWVNSQTAVVMGSKSIPGAVGKGDPREMKTYLEGRGIRCWLDVEQVNVNDQLFARIAKGLSEARVMVACVSDEYAKSENCVKEMKFAMQLSLPIIIAVVGTGTSWLHTEIGLLATAYPKVNFQDNPNEETLETLIRLVQDNMKAEPSEDTDTKESKEESEETNQISYQEMYELAQQKLLRQVSNNASTHDIGNYPRLFVVDVEETSSDIGKTVQYQVHTLCECDQGWHGVADPILLSTEERNLDEEDFDMSELEDFTPYLSRVAMVMEHNSGFVLNLYTNAEGQRCLQRIQELAMICSDSFQTSYQKLHAKVHELDTKGEKGKLVRCRLPSGKIIWLCEEHSVQMKVTVLSEDVSEVKINVTNQPWLDVMLDFLRNGATKQNPFEFKNNRKAKKKVQDMIAGVDDVVKNIRKSLLRKNSSLNKAAQLQALSEIKSQDATNKEEIVDSMTKKEKKEKKKKKRKDLKEEVEDFSKGSSSHYATSEKEVTDLTHEKKAKKKKRTKEKRSESPVEYSEEEKNKEDVKEAKMTTKMDERNLAISVSPDPTPVARSRTASPNPLSDIEVRRSTPSPLPDILVTTTSPQPRAGDKAEAQPRAGDKAETKPGAGDKAETQPMAGDKAETQPRAGDKAERDMGRDSDQQPALAKSKACVML